MYGYQLFPVSIFGERGRTRPYTLPLERKLLFVFAHPRRSLLRSNSSCRMTRVCTAVVVLLGILPHEEWIHFVTEFNRHFIGVSCELLRSWDTNGKVHGRWHVTSPCDDERTIALWTNALRAYEGKSSELIPPGPRSRESVQMCDGINSSAGRLQLHIFRWYSPTSFHFHVHTPSQTSMYSSICSPRTATINANLPCVLLLKSSHFQSMRCCGCRRKLPLK